MRLINSSFLLCLALTLTAAAANSQQPAVAGTTPVTRGAELFATKGCEFCHGKAGVGGGRGPDLQLVRKRKTAEQMMKQIHDGGMGMPPFGDQLTAPEIDDLVIFLRSKRKFIKVPPPPASN